MGATGARRAAAGRIRPRPRGARNAAMDERVGPHRARPREREAVSPPFLGVRGVAKPFARQAVREDLTLEIGQGEIVALLGRSGSGKTTALRLLAGLETPDRGTGQVSGADGSRRGGAR